MKANAICVCAILLLSSCRLQLPPDYTSEPHFHLYSYGETVRFGLGGDSHRFKLHGWSHTEPRFTWTDGVGASLIFLVPRTARQLTLNMKLLPFVHAPDLPVQPVQISINNRKIVTWDVNEEKVYSTVVPEDMVASRPDAIQGRPNLRDSVVLVIDLFMPKAHFPGIIVDAPDWRRLGVACSELVMLETSLPGDPGAGLPLPRKGENAPYHLGRLVRFGAGQNGQRYKRTGWHGAESGLTWSGKQPAVLKFKLAPTDRPLTLILFANGNTLPPLLLPQQTLVYANKQLVADWRVDALSDYTADIPAGVIGPNGVLAVELLTQDATSPKALGVNNDSRPLGLACYSLLILEADD